MATATVPVTTLPSDWSLADLQRHLGDVPLERIRIYPPPGFATEAHVLANSERENRLCELIDGILVEKAMGNVESVVAIALIHHLTNFLEEHDLGLLLGADGLVRLFPGQIRMPDVCFIRWNRLPNSGAVIPPVLDLAPDLAVEILSASNTRQEMQRKLEDDFQAGVQLVWYIDPATRSAKVYRAADACEEPDENGILDGASVLPGFSLPLRSLFVKLSRISSP